MELFNQLPKDLQVILILSPLFVLIFLLALLIKTGMRFAEKKPTFWLISTVIFALWYMYSLIYDDMSDLSVIRGIMLIISGIFTYFELSKSNTNIKKKKAKNN